MGCSIEFEGIDERMTVLKLQSRIGEQPHGQPTLDGTHFFVDMSPDEAVRRLLAGMQRDLYPRITVNGVPLLQAKKGPPRAPAAA